MRNEGKRIWWASGAGGGDGADKPLFYSDFMGHVPPTEDWLSYPQSPTVVVLHISVRSKCYFPVYPGIICLLVSEKQSERNKHVTQSGFLLTLGIEG